jgi:hypothetical protein
VIARVCAYSDLKRELIRGYVEGKSAPDWCSEAAESAPHGHTDYPEGWGGTIPGVPRGRPAGAVNAWALLQRGGAGLTNGCGRRVAPAQFWRIVGNDIE